MRRNVRSALFVAALVVGSICGSPTHGADYTLTIGNGSGAQGQGVDLPVILDNPRSALQGWSFGMCHDPASLELLSVADGAALLLLCKEGSKKYVHLPTGWHLFVSATFGGFPETTMLPVKVVKRVRRKAYYRMREETERMDSEDEALARCTHEKGVTGYLEAACMDIGQFHPPAER